jgi:hypothetical protein
MYGKKIVIYVEGDTEEVYFNIFKDWLDMFILETSLSVKICNKQGRDIDKAINKKGSASSGTEFFVVLDTEYRKISQENSHHFFSSPSFEVYLIFHDHSTEEMQKLFNKIGHLPQYFKDHLQRRYECKSMLDVVRYITTKNKVDKIGDIREIVRKISQGNKSYEKSNYYSNVYKLVESLSKLLPKDNIFDP